MLCWLASGATSRVIPTVSDLTVVITGAARVWGGKLKELNSPIPEVTGAEANTSDPCGPAACSTLTTGPGVEVEDEALAERPEWTRFCRFGLPTAAVVFGAAEARFERGILNKCEARKPTAKQQTQTNYKRSGDEFKI